MANTNDTSKLLAVIKGAVGTPLGSSSTGSWLPARTDPASTTLN
ncbi:hypothetical protein ACH40E_39605 [Streptomyces acidicola]